jgi:hypothetical protein
MLTQILQIRRLSNQPRNLIIAIIFLPRLTILARKFLFNTTKHLQRARVLHFLGFDVVGGGCDGRAVAPCGL